MMDIVDDTLYARDLQIKDYFYFMKLVPHVFVDQVVGREFNAYSYSLNHNSKVIFEALIIGFSQLKHAHDSNGL